MQKTIYTSYFGNYRNIPPEYQCVSIANSKPRIGVPTWCNVVPNWKDVEALKNNKMTSYEFALRYLHTLDSISVEQCTQYLNSFASDTIVLLCYEKHYFDCHRYLLGYWLHKNLLINIDEYPSDYYVPKDKQLFTNDIELIKDFQQQEALRANFWMED